MKKILKTLFDWRGRALQSQHLRTIVLLAFLVVGADVAWGLGIKRNISMTNVSVASNGTFTNNVYSWKDNTNNLLEFKDLTPNGGTTDLSEYDKIVIPVSNWSTGAIRCVIRVKTGDTSSKYTDYTWVMSDCNSSQTPVEKKLSLLDGDFKNGDSKITKDMLRKVMIKRDL